MFILSVQFFSVVARSLIGGIVGYFTNDLAIQMLFKKKFGLGGVVAKTRREFIENATDLVEEDVLTTEALQKEMKKEEFENALSRSIEDFIQIHLPAILSNGLSVGDLNGISNSYDRLAEVWLKHIETPIAEIYGILTKEMKSDELISQDQICTMARKVSNLIRDILQDGTYIYSFLRKLSDDLSQKTVADIIDPHLIHRLGDTVTSLASVSGEDMKKHWDKDLDQMFQILLEKLPINSLCSQLACSLTEKEWSKRIGEINIEQLISFFLERLIKPVESQSGKEPLCFLSHTLITILKKTDHSLFDLMPDRLSVKFEGFIYLRLAELIKDVIRWVEERRVDIERMVNLSLADRNLIARFIHSIGISLAEMFNIVDLLKKYISGEVELDRLADLSSREFVNLLKRNTLRDILIKMETGNTLTESSFAKILQESVVSVFHLLHPSVLRPYLKRLIDGLLTRNRLERLLNKAMSMYLPLFLKDRIVYRDRFSQTISDVVSKKMMRLKSQKIGEIIKKGIFDTESIEPQTLPTASLKAVQEVIEGYLVRFMEKSIRYKSIASLLGPTNSIQASLPEWLKKMVHKYRKPFRHLKLIHIYRKVAGQRVDHDLIADIRRLIVAHLHIFTKGGIKEISKSNLLNLSTSQLCTVVENFVGRELKPITRFGAGLGLIVGASLSFLPDVQSLGIRIGLPHPSATLGLSALMFGFVGWGTNWLALKMIFRPYFAKRIWGRRIPLTPGVVSRNKARFAKKMGEFVDDHLLRKSSIESMFFANSERIKSSIKKTINRDSFRIIDHQVNLHNSKLARQFGEFVATRINVSNPQFVALIDMLLNRLEGLKLEEIPLEKLIQGAERTISDQSATLQSDIPSWFLREEIRKKKLSHFVTPSMLDRFESYVFDQILNWIDLHKKGFSEETTLTRCIESYGRHLRQFADRSILDLIDSGHIKRIKTYLFSRIIRLFNSMNGNAVITGHLLKILDREVNPNRRIDELFGGRLINFTERNIDRLTHYLLKSALLYVRRNHKKIAENVYRTLLQNADFLTAQAIRLAKEELFETIENIAKVRLQQFFDMHESSLQALVRKHISVIGATKLDTIGAEFDRGKIRVLMNRCLSNKELLRVGRQFTDEFLRIFLQERVWNYLDLVGIDSTEAILRLIDKELRSISDFLQQVVSLHKKQLAAVPARFARKVLVRFLSQTDIDQLLVGIPLNQARASLEGLLKIVLQSDSFRLLSKNVYIDTINRIKANSVADLLDVEILKRDLLFCIDQLMEKRTTREKVVSVLTNLLKNILPRLNGALDVNTKNAVLDLAVEGFDLTLKQHMDSLLRAIDFNDIVVTQIDKMHPRKIKRTFVKFAGRYFPKLIHYGFFFGLIFGFLMDIFYFGLLRLLE